MPRFRAAAFAAVLALPWVAAAPAAAGEKISPALTRAFAASADGRAEMLVVLAEQADLTLAAALPTKAAKGRFVFERLSETAERTQGPLLAELARRGAPSRPFWAANFVWTKGDLSLAQPFAHDDQVRTGDQFFVTEPLPHRITRSRQENRDHEKCRAEQTQQRAATDARRHRPQPVER